MIGRAPRPTRPARTEVEAGVTTGGKLVVLMLAIGLAIPSAAAPLAAAAEDTVVTSLNFENGSWSPWAQSGGPALSVVDDAGDGVLQVANRANDFDGIKSPPACSSRGRVRVLDGRQVGDAGHGAVPVVTDPGFTWIGNTTVNGDGWTTVTGSFTPSAAPPSPGLHRQRKPFGRRQPVHVSRRRHRRHHRVDRPHHRRPSESSSAPTSRDGLGGWRRAARPRESDGGGHHLRGARWRPGGAGVEPRRSGRRHRARRHRRSWSPAARTRSRLG